MGELTKDQRINELTAAWRAVEASGLLADPRFKYLSEDVAVIRTAVDKAARGELDDVGELTGAEVSARRVMETLWDATKDVRFGAERRPWGGDLEAATAALRAAAVVNDPTQAAKDAADAANKAVADALKDAARDAARDAAKAIPLPLKIGIGVALLLALVLAVKA